MVSRRQLLAAGAAGGAVALIPAGWAASGRALAAVAPLDAGDIPKYVAPLRIPPAMPAVATGPERDEYVIAVRQFRQQILPRPWPRTTVWGYGSTAHAGSFGCPAPTIMARVGRPVRVTWVNQLVDDRGDHLPHLLPVDPTLHWANPAGGVAHRDRRRGPERAAGAAATAVAPQARPRPARTPAVAQRAEAGESTIMLLGVLDERGRGLPLRWSDPPTEQPTLGDTEVWEVRNFTRHVHPVHLHQVQFELLGRGHSGSVRPEPGDRGWMDTVLAYPWEVTRIKARFDRPGRYAWHCHLLEHEDNEMMRPLNVLPRGAAEAGDGGAAAGDGGAASTPAGDGPASTPTG
ncbi:multicopper oxidase domain-containing protein [Micromonospora chokoriensis]